MRRMWRSVIAGSLLALVPASSASADARVVRFGIDVSSSRATAPVQIRVDDGARVTVVVTKNMFHACTVASKVEALPAPPNPIAQIIGILGAIPGTPLTLREQPQHAPPAPPGLEPLQREVEGLVHDVQTLNVDLDAQAAEIRERANSLPDWIACDRTTLCSDADVARAGLRRLASAIQGTPSTPIGSTAVASARMTELVKTLTAKIDEPADGMWLEWAFGQIRTIQELIDTAVERRQLVLKGREALLAVRERVLAFTPSIAIEEPLSPQDNARTVVTVACTNVVTQQPLVYAKSDGDRQTVDRIPPISATVIYQDAPRATVSGGLLYSLADRRDIGIAAHRIGVDDAGVVAYQRRIVESDRAAWQLVPFSFVNVMVPGARAGGAALAASLGVGLNPNNGSTVAEYFAGGAIAIGRAVTVQIGAHIGTRLEPAEQFGVGDVLPDKLTAVPTTRTRATALGVALSYALPLPR